MKNSINNTEQTSNQTKSGVACTTVFVVDCNNNSLMPCTPRRARLLLKSKRADVYKMRPFTVRILDRDIKDSDLQEVELKIDPGSKTTGLVVMVKGVKRGWMCINAWELAHRGQQIKNSILSRAQVRRSRRGRKTRYRAPRFLNRKRKTNWLPPSLQSRVDNILSFAKKIGNICPVSEIVVEHVRFDLQQIQNPEISGLEYQQGELVGYEIREYLLLKWKHQCAYCSISNVPLQIEHIVPKSKGGSNRVSNLCIACQTCNQKKGSQLLKVFLANKPKLFFAIQKQANDSLKDASAVNTTHKTLVRQLKQVHFNVSKATGGQTKFNRTNQSLPKAHWIDAACVGPSGQKVDLSRIQKITVIQAKGRGSRRMCLVNKYGFPRTVAKSIKRLHGFQTGDYVRLHANGKYKGIHEGVIAIRKTGFFDINAAKIKITSSYKNFTLLSRFDGYTYSLYEINSSFSKK